MGLRYIALALYARSYKTGAPKRADGKEEWFEFLGAIRHKLGLILKRLKGSLEIECDEPFRVTLRDQIDGVELFLSMLPVLRAATLEVIQLMLRFGTPKALGAAISGSRVVSDWAGELMILTTTQTAQLPNGAEFEEIKRKMLTGGYKYDEDREFPGEEFQLQRDVRNAWDVWSAVTDSASTTDDRIAAGLCRLEELSYNGFLLEFIRKVLVKSVSPRIVEDRYRRLFGPGFCRASASHVERHVCAIVLDLSARVRRPAYELCADF